jgi:drug/metabolite transporter (DMT)-like permease
MPPPPTAVADVSVFAGREPALVPAAVSHMNFQAIGLIVLSTIAFSLSDIAAKSLMDNMHPIEVVWFRYLLFAVMALPAALWVGGLAGLKSAMPGLQIVRGLAIVGSSTLFVVGLSMMPLAETTALAFLGPIFITALSIPLLGEKVGRHRWAAAFAGFIGVLIVARPGTDAFQLAAFFPIAAALTGALGAILMRMIKADKSETTLAWSAMVGFAFLTALVPFYWVTPTPDQWVAAIVMGILSTLGQALVVYAFRMANASLLAPYSYSQLFFVGLFGFIAFGVIPGFWTIIGVAVIAASGLYTAHRERVRRLVRD